VNKRNKIILTATVMILALASPGCSVTIINKLRAKAHLNEGVREFNKGKFEIAEEKFAAARKLAPDLPNAQLYYAQTLNKRFEQGLEEGAGMRAIDAFEDVIKGSQDPKAIDQALAFQANVYDQLSRSIPDKKNEFIEKRRQILLKRADMPSATTQAKADVYYTIGHSYWQESYYGFSERYAKVNQTIPPNEVEKMKPIIQKAHEYLQRAIATDPIYANAYFYEKLVYLEEAKTLPPDRARALDAKVKEMQDMYTKASAAQKEKEAANAAAQTPSQ
jgi:hypothetical protein